MVHVSVAVDQDIKQTGDLKMFQKFPPLLGDTCVLGHQHAKNIIIIIIMTRLTLRRCSAVVSTFISVVRMVYISHLT